MTESPDRSLRGPVPPAMQGAAGGASTVHTPQPALSPLTRGAYGLLGLPLAMAALPLYVYLPKYYGDLGVSLAALGALLLVLRLADGVLDPLLGAFSDRARSRKTLIAWAMPVLAAGMIALFVPPSASSFSPLAWLALALTIVYAAYSVAMINHGAWGAELSTDPVERTRLTAVREALALAGVVIASVVPSFLGGTAGDAAGLPRFAFVFAAIACACTFLALARAPAPVRSAAPLQPWRAGLARAVADHAFRRLLLVFVANGIASAIPATLVLFFIADVLQGEARQGMFLAIYFIAGAAGMPLWVALSARAGKAQAWGVSMLVAIAAFIWAAGLSAGDHAAFAVICALSGLALGADLALPPSLLADIIGRDGASRDTGAYFGIWTLATKLNLALAAGIALPLLGALGYVPGSREPQALTSLAIVYAAVPCALKLVALATLVWFSRRRGLHA